MNRRLAATINLIISAINLRSLHLREIRSDRPKPRRSFVLAPVASERAVKDFRVRPSGMNLYKSFTTEISTCSALLTF